MTTIAKKKKKGKINYGNVNIDPEEFNPRNVKIRVTMFVDEEVLDAFRAAAEKHGVGYQTLMNQKLRESLQGLDKTIVDRVAALEIALSGLAKKAG